MPDEERTVRLTDETAFRLTEAVLAQAAGDYRAAAASCRRAPNAEALRMLRDVETFFCSGYFRAVTGMEGRPLLERLRKETGTLARLCAGEPGE